MAKPLHILLTDERAEALAHICEVAGRTKTEVINGMIDHWAEVIKDHEARGFRIVPTREFRAVMFSDRAGMFDELAKDKGGISAEMPEG